MRTITNTLVFVLGFGLATASVAQEFYVYPAKGQSKEQTEQDKFQCYNWAKGETDFDPMQMPTASTPPPTQEPQKGGVLRGAAAGAVIGQIADDKAGEGAAIGALFGGARRRNLVRQEEYKREQWEQQQANQYANARNQYNRAYVACLEARGYSVK